VVRAARIPVVGRERVAKFIASFASHFWNGLTLEWVETNGQPSVLLLRDGVAVALATVDAWAEGIHQTLWIMRPSKLASLASSVHRRTSAPPHRNFPSADRARNTAPAPRSFFVAARGERSVYSVGLDRSELDCDDDPRPRCVGG
jgi:hypothetical protein